MLFRRDTKCLLKLLSALGLFACSLLNARRDVTNAVFERGLGACNGAIKLAGVDNVARRNRGGQRRSE